MTLTNGKVKYQVSLRTEKESPTKIIVFFIYFHFTIKV